MKSLSGPATVSNESNFVTVSSTMGMGRRNETMMCKPGDLHKIILQTDILECRNKFISKIGLCYMHSFFVVLLKQSNCFGKNNVSFLVERRM